MKMFTVLNVTCNYVEAIAATEAKALRWIVDFLEEYEYVLDEMDRIAMDAPLIIRAHEEENPKKKIEFYISETEVVP